MGLQFGTIKTIDDYESSLVFFLDPANPSCFAGPPTSNSLGEGMGIYNNRGADITVTLEVTNEWYRGARVYKESMTPTTAAGVSWMTSGNNPGLGVVTGGGGGPANTYTGHSIFFKPMFTTHTNPIYTNYSNVGGWQSSTLFEPSGDNDGWFRAYTTWFDTTTRNDGKYWAINPQAGELNKTYVCYWAGPFKEQQPQNAFLGTYGARAINPYIKGTRPANPSTILDTGNPYDSQYNHGGIHDLSGRQNHADINGTIVYRDFAGGCLKFDGSTYIRTLNNALNPNAAEFTLEAWAQTSTASGWQTVIGTESTLRQIGFLNNTIAFGGNGGGGNIFRYVYNGTVQTDTWYHLVFTFDGLYPRCYVNGVLEDTGSLGSIGALSGKPGPGRTFIGTYNNGGSEALNGHIGIVRVYNRALTTEQVQHNYNATKYRYGK